MKARHKTIAGLVAAIGIVLVYLSFSPATWWGQGKRGFVPGKSAEESFAAARTQRTEPDSGLASGTDRQWEIVFKMLDELDQDDSALDLNDEESIRRWCEPLLELEEPVMETFLSAFAPLGGHAVMVTATIIFAIQWDGAVEELLNLVDSKDERLRLMAREVVTAIYQLWTPKRRQEYGPLDLVMVLQNQYRKHGLLSYHVLEAISRGAIWDRSLTEGAEPVIDMDWFDSPPIPEKFHDLQNPQTLAAAMASDSWRVRSSAVWHSFYQKNASLMMAGLRDPDDRVTLTALEYLMDEESRVGPLLRSQTEYAGLLHQLRTRADPRVRTLATWAYGELVRGDPELGDGLLIESLNDRAPSAQQWALDVLRETEMLPNAEEEHILGMVMASPDLGVRFSAARLLRKLGTPETKRELNEWLQRDESLQRYLTSTLGQVHDL